MGTILADSQAAASKAATQISVSPTSSTASSTAVGTVKEARALLEAGAGLVKELLPPSLDPGRFVRVCLNAIQSNPELLLCTRSSLLLSVLQCAELGLQPSLGQAYLVPLRVSKRYPSGQVAKVWEAQMWIGYRGLRDLAMRSGRYAHIEAHVVGQNDEFELELGLSPRLLHRPNLDDPGECRAAYAIAWPADGSGRPWFEVMARRQLDAIQQRAVSRGGANNPWVTDTDEMRRKTVLRRFCKSLDLTPEAARYIERDGLAEAGALVPAAVASSVLSGASASAREAAASVLSELGAADLPAAAETVVAADVEAEVEAPAAPAEERPAPSAENPAEATAAPVDPAENRGPAGEPRPLPPLRTLYDEIKHINDPEELVALAIRDRRRNVDAAYESRLWDLVGRARGRELMERVWAARAAADKPAV